INERQVDDAFLIDDSPQSGIFRLNKRRLGTDRDLFLGAADCELNLHPGLFGNLNLNTFQDEWLKSGRANCKVIRARSEEWDREIPLAIRSEIALFLCGLTLDEYCRTRDQRSTGVA